MSRFPRAVRLTKLSDDRFNGNHPNEVYEGAVREGIIHHAPTVGMSVFLSVVIKMGGAPFEAISFYTSTVTEIISKNKFKTNNSTYKIEYLKV